MTINNSFYSDIIAGILFQIHIIKYSYFQFFLTILCLMVVGSAVVMVDGMEDHSLYGPWHPILVHPEADQCHLEYFSRFPSRFRTSVILMREINRWTTLNLLCHRHTLFRRIFFFDGISGIENKGNLVKSNHDESNLIELDFGLPKAEPSFVSSSIASSVM